MCNYFETIPAEAPRLSKAKVGETSPPDLRPYQHEAVEAIREAFKRYRRVLYVLPTGGGKTVMFAFVVMQRSGEGQQHHDLGTSPGDR